ncbi:hypothetical protein G6M26_06595 [Agrobacterium tumefaciens]|nr:hypothetical protein [Agrobacterium tumefaciens]NTE18185.1 hypothetical protein [Agrobacterium tumefaciens]
MKFLKLILISLLFYSCNGDMGSGALGGWDIIVFKTSEKNLKIAIDSLYKIEPKYHHIKKWKYEADYWIKDHSYLETTIFYFREAPEEMYYVTYVGLGTGDNPNYSRLAIRGVENGNGSWKRYDDFSSMERLRISRRFEIEIVKQLERITGAKSYVEKKYR